MDIMYSCEERLFCVSPLKVDIRRARGAIKTVREHSSPITASSHALGVIPEGGQNTHILWKQAWSAIKSCCVWLDSSVTSYSNFCVNNLLKPKESNHSLYNNLLKQTMTVWPLLSPRYEWPLRHISKIQDIWSVIVVAWISRKLLLATDRQRDRETD